MSCGPKEHHAACGMAHQSKPPSRCHPKLRPTDCQANHSQATDRRHWLACQVHDASQVFIQKQVEVQATTSLGGPVPDFTSQLCENASRTSQHMRLHEKLMVVLRFHGVLLHGTHCSVRSVTTAKTCIKKRRCAPGLPMKIHQHLPLSDKMITFPRNREALRKCAKCVSPVPRSELAFQQNPRVFHLCLGCWHWTPGFGGASFMWHSGDHSAQLLQETSGLGGRIDRREPGCEESTLSPSPSFSLSFSLSLSLSPQALWDSQHLCFICSAPN